MLGRLIFKLSHTAQLTKLRITVQDPCQLRMGSHVALDEHQALLRIDTAGQQQRKGIQRLFAQRRRILTHSQRMQIRNKIGTVKIFLHLAPVADRTNIVTQGKNTCRLNTTQYYFLTLRLSFCLRILNNFAHRFISSILNN